MDYKNLLNKTLLNYLLGFSVIIVWIRLLSGDFLLNSFIAISVLGFVDLINTGLFNFDRVKSFLFYFWLINIVFWFAGGLFGGLGILLASIFLLGRIVYRALSSKFYKDSVNNIVADIRSRRKK